MAYQVEQKFKGRTVTGMDNFTSSVKDVSDVTKSITCIASTDEPDRYGDIIDQDGWVLKHFKKNPVICKFHQYAELPVARAVEVWTELKGDVNRLMARIQFSPTEEGTTFYEMYKSKFLRGFSVGFLPIKSQLIEQEKDDDKPFFLHEPRKFIKSELLEISCVGIPANSSCLAEVKSFVARGRLPGQCLSYGGEFGDVLDGDDDEVIHLIEDEERDIVTVGHTRESLRSLVNSTTEAELRNALGKL